MLSSSRRPLCTLLLVTALALPGPAAAQDQAEGLTPREVGQMTLRELMAQEVVFAAARYEQRPSEAATSVTIITAQEIRQFGYRTMQDVLSAVRGFYTTYDRNYSYLGIRGISPPGDYNARVLVQVDGHRVNENTYDGVYIGTDSLVDLGLVERVEVVHGPGSSLYGSNAVFAVVNFITRSGSDLPALQVEGDVGSFGTEAARVRLGGRMRAGTDVLFSATRYTSNGQRSLFFPELAASTATAGVTRGTDADDYLRLFGKLSRGPWSLQGAHADRTKQIPTAAYNTVFNDPRSQTTDRRSYASLGYRAPAQQRTGISGQVAVDHYSYRGDYPTDYGEADAEDIVVNHDHADGTWLTVDLQVTRRIGSAHHLVGGTEYRDNQQSIGNFDRVVYTDIDARTRVLGLFAQDEWRLHPRLALMLGLRHDRYPSFGGTTNPRLAVIYSPAANTTIKLTHGRAFRPPNLSERSDELSPTPGLSYPLVRPETMTARELIVEHRTDRLLGGEGWFSVSMYRSHLDDLIGTFVVDGWSHAGNLGTAHARGMEFEARAQWPNRIVARGSLSLNRAVNGDEQPLANAPRRLATARVQVPVWGDQLGIGLQGSFVASRLSADGTTVPAAATADLTVLWTPARRHLTLSANVRNLFDASVYGPTSEAFRQSRLRQDGRTFYLSTGWRF